MNFSMCDSDELGEAELHELGPQPHSPKFVTKKQVWGSPSAPRGLHCRTRSTHEIEGSFGDGNGRSRARFSRESLQIAIHKDGAFEEDSLWSMETDASSTTTGDLDFLNESDEKHSRSLACEEHSPGPTEICAPSATVISFIEEDGKSLLRKMSISCSAFSSWSIKDRAHEEDSPGSAETDASSTTIGDLDFFNESDDEEDPFAEFVTADQAPTKSGTSGKCCKTCSKCSKPYSGFGNECGSCRRRNPCVIGPCTMCGGFILFNADFGDAVCDDCEAQQKCAARGACQRPRPLSTTSPGACVQIRTSTSSTDDSLGVRRQHPRARPSAGIAVRC